MDFNMDFNMDEEEEEKKEKEEEEEECWLWPIFVGREMTIFAKNNF
jgi:hypothetical protein